MHRCRIPRRRHGVGPTVRWGPTNDGLRVPLVPVPVTISTVPRVRPTPMLRESGVVVGAHRRVTPRRGLHGVGGRAADGVPRHLPLVLVPQHVACVHEGQAGTTR